MAGGTGDQGGPGDTELDADLNEVNPDEDPENEAADGEDEAEGSEDDAGEAGGSEGEDDDGGDDAQAQRQGQRRHDVAPRREGRYQRLANENRELRGKVSEFERTLQSLVQQQRQPTQAEIAAEAERERQAIELMTPAEVAAYYARKTENTINQRLARQEQVLFERADKQDYEGLLERNPAYKRYDAKVEELKRQAPGVERRILLATAIGMAAMEGSGRARTRATNAAEAARTRQTARPSNGRGDVRSDRGRGGASSGNFEHLRNVAI